jgi:CelD/BcsL family acetyltransferase involved in cellulose biosynthesis
MIAVSEINTFEELANLRVTWRELWEKTPNASFVQSWDWLRSYWRVYGDKQELRTLLVTLRTKPIGIVPLVTRGDARADVADEFFRSVLRRDWSEPRCDFKYGL